jgi:hemophore-related protein
MRMRLMTKLVAGSCGLAFALTTGAGIASAQPDVSPIINSTCTYPQVMAALNAQSPDMANQISSNPMATAWLQQLVASPPAGRRQMVQQAQGVPAVQQYTGLIFQVAGTCNNF